MMENKCRVCNNTEHLLIKRNNKESWFLCKRCLFLYRYPVSDIEADMVDNIRYRYGFEHLRSEGLFLKSVEYKKILWQYFMRQVKGFSPKKVLDFGSGDGPLLEYLKEEGVEAVGVEPSRQNSEFSILRGHKVISGFMKPETFGRDSFDVIFLQNCGTYIVNLREVFDIFRGILKDGGYIFWQDKQYHGSALSPAKHLSDNGPACYFSTPSLYNLLSLSGFRIVSYKNIWGDFYLVAVKSGLPEAIKGDYRLEHILIKALPVTDCLLYLIRQLLNAIKAPVRYVLMKLKIHYSYLGGYTSYGQE